jgi:uncharacterized protein (TIRG00374 family)
MKLKPGIILQYIFFLALGLFLVWWSIKDIDAQKWAEIKQALAEARIFLIIPVFGILLLSHYARALRWRLLMEPMGYHTSKRNTFFAVMIGYLANTAVPRLGEVLKCTILARYEKVPADKLVGTIVQERLIDAFCFAGVLLLTLAVQPDLYSRFIDTWFYSNSGEPSTGSSNKWLIPLIVLAVITLLVALWMIIKKKSFRDLATALKLLVQRVWQGLTTIRHMKKRKSFIFLTIIIWAGYLGSGYIGFLALQETSHFGFKESLTVLSAGTIGMIVPTPGGIGAYAYFIESTMMVYGLPQSIATAFGWLLWLSQTIIVLIAGCISVILLPVFNKQSKSKL